RFDHTDDQKPAAGNQNHVADGVLRQIQLHDRLLVDEAHLPALLLVDAIERPAVDHLPVLDLVPLGPDAGDRGIDCNAAALDRVAAPPVRIDDLDRIAVVANGLDLFELELHLAPVDLVAHAVRAGAGDEHLARAE